MVFKPHFISTDTYKLKVEKTIKGVLGRPGGGEILANLYHWAHPNVSEERIPYWFKRLIIGELWHLIRKGICRNEKGREKTL